MSNQKQELKQLFNAGKVSIEEIDQEYNDWLKELTYVIIHGFNMTTGEQIYAFIKGVKRGDQDYSDQIQRKFYNLRRNNVKDTIFFNKKQRENIEGNAVLVTLEYDANKNLLSEAWENNGKDWNRFLTNVKNKFKNYGKISQIRVFESHESGFPHIHAILIFKDIKFKGKRMWSIPQNRWINRVWGSQWYTLRSCWKHGFSDFELIDSYRGGLKYLSKYLEKSTNYKLAGNKGKQTIILC